MKKCAVLLCALILMIAFSACGDTNHTDQTAGEPTEAVSQADSLTAEKVFDKMFQAEKDYDVDTLAEIEYSVNFKSTADKEKLVENVRSAKNELDPDKLEEYKAGMKDLSYTILSKDALSADALAARKTELAANDYRDTDKINEIIKLKYRVDSGSGDDTQDKEVEMICVDGVWYCYIGDGLWYQ